MTEYQITYRGIVHDQQGYARASRGYLLGLDKAGVDVRLEPLNFGTAPANIDMEQVKRLKELIQKPRNLNKKQILVYHSQPYGVDARKERHDNGFDKVIINTVWETTKIPDSWFPHINYADAVVVPSSQNVKALQDSGVTIPIFKVSHGSDVDKFSPDNEKFEIENVNLEDTFKFLSIFQWQHRKAPEKLLRAYWNEFSGRDKVALIIKTYFSSNTRKSEERAIIETIHRYKNFIGKEDTAPVFVSTSLFGDSDIKGLYTLSDVFVLPSRGEGVGLPYIEAMSSGIPCISTGWGGQTDFINNDNGYLLDYTLRPTTHANREAISQTFDSIFSNSMHWAEVDDKDLQAMMRHVYNNQEEVKSKGKVARFDMAGMTWNDVGHVFKNSIEELL